MFQNTLQMYIRTVVGVTDCLESYTVIELQWKIANFKKRWSDELIKI